MTGRTERDDAALDALRYVLGEMDAAESERFEGRLSEDQAAREAVADAVLIAQAAGRVPVEAGRPARRVRILRVAAAAGLLLAAVAAWRMGAGGSSSGAAPEDEQLIALWLELDEGEAADSLTGSGNGSEGAGSLGEALDPDAAEDDGEEAWDDFDEDPIPDWLLMALEDTR